MSSYLILLLQFGWLQKLWKVSITKVIIVKYLLGLFLFLFEYKVGDEQDALLWGSFNIFSRLMELRLKRSPPHWRVFQDYFILEWERACTCICRWMSLGRDSKGRGRENLRLTLGWVWSCCRAWSHDPVISTWAETKSCPLTHCATQNPWLESF